MKLVRSNDPIEFIKRIVWDHKSPTTINFYWNSGSYASLYFGIQFLTGIVVSTWYVNHLVEIFPVLDAVYREIPNGWFFRYVHAMTASWFFFMVYIHMYKNMFFSNFLGPKVIVWQIGVAILFLMIATAFLGYALPYGQMSLWAATVITNLVTAIPFIGDDLCLWIRGDYIIGPVTVPRFFVLHVILPFVILALVFLHVHYLHKSPSAEPKGNNASDQADLSPYPIWRDLYGCVMIWFLFIIGAFTYPSIFVDIDNYTLANLLVTPEHITPEWYLCMYYAIVRSIENKLLGVLISIGSIGLLLAVPYFSGSNADNKGSSVSFKLGTVTLVILQMLLIWLGTQPIEEPFITISKLTVFLYFFVFLILLA